MTVETTFRNEHVAAPLKGAGAAADRRPVRTFRNEHVAAPLKGIIRHGPGPGGHAFRNEHVAAPLKEPSCASSRPACLPFRNEHVAAPLKGLCPYFYYLQTPFIPQRTCCGPIEGRPMTGFCGRRRAAFRNEHVAAPLKDKHLD